MRAATLVAASIVAEVRNVPPLAVALRSHPLLHAAEGQLCRKAIAEAAEEAGLVVHHVFAARATQIGPHGASGRSGPPRRAAVAEGAQACRCGRANCVDRFGSWALDAARPLGSVLPATPRAS
jgi:hypothetical protein